MNHAGLRRSAVPFHHSHRLRVVRQCVRRTLKTATTESIESDLDLPPPLPESSSRHSKVRDPVPPEETTIFVRPWDGIQTMPELLAMIRGLERRYGRIREYEVMRDYDFRSLYIPYFWINFEDTASLERTPETPHLLKVDTPVVDLARSGGIGLEDLQGLLNPEDYVSPEDDMHEHAPYTSSTARGEESAFPSPSTSAIDAYIASMSPKTSAADAADPSTNIDAVAAASTQEAKSARQASPLSKRQRILARARANARAPLPVSVPQTDEDQLKAKEEKRMQEKEEEDRVRTTVRERLWNLVGSKWM
ncbi:uncharacterized protein B0H18DRAFT_1104001 [Fomitopsis serialis]|uniref:uncharacterized protein n=1 Tax=Fomitopsis serialis TaxID=139415 RepID=UPI002007EC7C|nr:uncharacterized protein B0H18DRAFT_1104001 [Neoantrodia serialis]KAH9927832.1 hypothetical protein B0H18DRAFT_1104001 [Neoantrodia serialis]